MQPNAFYYGNGILKNTGYPKKIPGRTHYSKLQVFQKARKKPLYSSLGLYISYIAQPIKNE